MSSQPPASMKIDSDGKVTIVSSPEFLLSDVEVFQIIDTRAKSVSILKTTSERHDVFTCIAPTSGYFFARCNVARRSTNQTSLVECKPVLYIQEKRQLEIASILSEAGISDNENNQRLPYFRSPSPQIDFILDYSQSLLGGEDRVPFAFSDGLLWEYRDFEFGSAKCSIYSAKQLIPISSGSLIFSGYCWCDGVFHFGDGAIENNSGSFSSPLEHLGTYSYCLVEKDRVELGTDFLGFGRLFYYRCEDRLLVSNRYHLLLEYANEVGIALGFDFGRLSVQLLSNVTFFRQVFSHELLVERTHLLPSYKRIEITSQGVEFKDTHLKRILDEPIQWNEERYRDILESSATEIVENIKAAIRSPKYQNVVVDLSGGRDSRVGYAAVTNIPADSRQKVRIRSTLHEPDDLHTAIGVNSFFDLPYFDDGEVIEPIELKKGLEFKRSYYLGYHFLWYCPTKRVEDQGRLRFTGESFEALSVRYYSNVLKDPKATISNDKLIDEFLRILSRQCALDFSTFEDAFRETLKNVLEELPGTSAQEKFDSMFLLFRGSFHAGNLDRMYYEPHCCMPLQSKRLLLAKRMWLSRENWNRVIYDITFILNPLLALLPYNSLKSNNEFSSHRAEMLLGDSCLSDAHVKFPSPLDVTKWDAAHNLKQERDKIVAPYGDQLDPRALVGETEDVKKIIRKEFLRMLGALYCSGQFPLNNWREKIFIPLYWYATDFTRDSDEIRICHHKIASIYDLAKIIRASRI